MMCTTVSTDQGPDTAATEREELEDGQIFKDLFHGHIDYPCCPWLIGRVAMYSVVAFIAGFQFVVWAEPDVAKDTRQSSEINRAQAKRFMGVCSPLLSGHRSSERERGQDLARAGRLAAPSLLRLSLYRGNFSRTTKTLRSTPLAVA